jgi:hypothetical protein
MYQTSGPKQAYADSFGGLELVDIEIASDVRTTTQGAENFDLYEWALEFSKAVGFEIERAPIAVED